MDEQDHSHQHGHGHQRRKHSGEHGHHRHHRSREGGDRNHRHRRRSGHRTHEPSAQPPPLPQQLVPNFNEFPNDAIVQPPTANQQPQPRTEESVLMSLIDAELMQQQAELQEPPPQAPHRYKRNNGHHHHRHQHRSDRHGHNNSSSSNRQQEYDVFNSTNNLSSATEDANHMDPHHPQQLSQKEALRHRKAFLEEREHRRRMQAALQQVEDPEGQVVHGQHQKRQQQSHYHHPRVHQQNQSSAYVQMLSRTDTSDGGAEETTSDRFSSESNLSKSKPDQNKYMCGKAEQALFSRSSSTSGTDSSIRIRKTRSGCTERRWFICVSLALIFTIFVAAAGIYFGYQFLRSAIPQTEVVYRGQFTVLDGDFLPEGVAEIGSYIHVEKSRFYQHKLDLIFSGSQVAEEYIRNEVFLLEGHGIDGMTVYFNLHMTPSKKKELDFEGRPTLDGESENSQDDTKIEAEELIEIILREVGKSEESPDTILGDLLIDEESVDIQERTPGSSPPYEVYSSRNSASSSSGSGPGSVFYGSSSSSDPSFTGSASGSGPGTLSPSNSVPSNINSRYDATGSRLNHSDEEEEYKDDFTTYSSNSVDVDSPVDVEKGRQCVPFQVDFCRQLPYNFTTFPNAMGHKNIRDAKYDIEWFKEIVDSKCYGLSYEFVCQLLQPVCYKEQMVLPCRDFCFEFMKDCGNILPGELKNRINCEEFKDEKDGPGACIAKPGCVAEMRTLGRGDRVCDGVVDCPDFSDELYCPYCPEHYFHCGVGKNCVPKDKMCDGFIDCDNAADEKGCLSLAPHMDFASYVHQYYDNGYLVFQEGGKAGKVCADDMNKTIPSTEVGRVLDKLGESMCNMLEYSSLTGINIVEDSEIRDEDKGGVQYVDMTGPMSSDRSFISVPCYEKQVVKIACDGLECGRRPAHVRFESRTREEEGRTKVLHGDWPWHATLIKNDLHACDAVLVDKEWILTTQSCFQGQGKAKWIARFASTRLDSHAPWEQTRRIVGMVKTPVEGNSLVMLKLHTPVIFSDFVRPICLPSSDEFIHMGATCVTLSWNMRDEEMHLTYLEPADREKCAEASEISPNTICTRAKSDSEECDGEEFAGAPLMCQASGEWHLVGVSSWRRGCTDTARRPRTFDKVSLNSEWVRRTIDEMSKKSS